MKKSKQLHPDTVAEIRFLLGNVDDDIVLAICRLEATKSDIIQALKQIEDSMQSDLNPLARPICSPIVASIRDILESYHAGSDECL